MRTASPIIFSNTDSANGKNDYLVPTNVENLYVMPSGALPPNPAELLGGSRLVPAIERLKSGFDLVLFDAPPVLAAADTALLAARLGWRGAGDQRKPYQARRSQASQRAIIARSRRPGLAWL